MRAACVVKQKSGVGFGCEGGGDNNVHKKGGPAQAMFEKKRQQGLDNTSCPHPPGPQLRLRSIKMNANYGGGF